MKYDLYNQFSPKERALILLNKYPLKYLKDIINGQIEVSKENNEIKICAYWNEVSKEVKKLIIEHNKNYI